MKKLLILANCLISPAVFPITNGFSFANLGRSSDIYKIATATVGIKTFPKNGLVDYCTGIAFSQHQFLTTAHCVESSPVDSKIEIRQYNPDGYDVPHSTKISKIIIPASFKETYGKNGDDIALVTLPENIVLQPLVSTQIFNAEGEAGLDKYADLLWVGNPKIYQIGWGGKGKFEYAAWNQYNAKSDASSMSFAVQPISRITNNYNSAKKFLLGRNKAVLKVNDRPNLMSNPNRITMDVNYGSEGDSGGPFVICKSDNSDCQVIGIYRGAAITTYHGGGGAAFAIISSLINPNFTEIKLTP